MSSYEMTCAHEQLCACAHTLIQDEPMRGCSEPSCACAHKLMHDHKLTSDKFNQSIM